jgi:hypothetical protein
MRPPRLSGKRLTRSPIALLSGTPQSRAEQYHQFHNGLGKSYPREYLSGLKQKAARAGRIDTTGCPEIPF